MSRQPATTDAPTETPTPEDGAAPEAPEAPAVAWFVRDSQANPGTFAMQDAGSGKRQSDLRFDGDSHELQALANAATLPVYAQMMRDEIPQLAAVEHYRAQLTRLQEAEADLEVHHRRLRRAELDKDEAIGSKLSGEKLTRRLGAVAKAVDQANEALRESTRGLHMLRNLVAEARTATEASIEKLDAEVHGRLSRELHAQRDAHFAALARDVAPALTGFVVTMQASGILAMSAVRKQQRVGLLDDIAGQGPAEAPAEEPAPVAQAEPEADAEEGERFRDPHHDARYRMMEVETAAANQR